MTNNSHTRTIAVTSGGQATGKSTLIVNLALELGTLGKNVVLLDSDNDPIDASLLSGVTPNHHLGEFLAGSRELNDVFYFLSPNVRLLHGGTALHKLSRKTKHFDSLLLKKLNEIDETLDYLLIDHDSDTAGNITGIHKAAAEIVIVTTPEPASVIDTYRRIKSILQTPMEKQINIIVNRVAGTEDAEEVWRQISQTVKRFLKHRVRFLGLIPFDPRMTEAMHNQTPIVRFAPDSPSSKALRVIAKQIELRAPSGASADPDSSDSFWHRLRKT